MIILNSVSKEVGKGLLKKLILENINWVIRPRCRIVVLGQRGSGKSTLLDLLAGMTVPTHGWVERRAMVSVPGGLLRYAIYDSPRQLILRLSHLYHADPKEITEFILQVTQMGDLFDIPVRRLPGVVRSQLNLALTYAYPCDFYLFDGGIEGGRKREFREFCQRAFEYRSRQAGTIIVTGVSRVARLLGQGAMGGVLYQRKLTLYESVEDAIAVFESLPLEEPSPRQYQPLFEREVVPDEEEIF